MNTRSHTCFHTHSAQSTHTHTNTPTPTHASVLCVGAPATAARDRVNVNQIVFHALSPPHTRAPDRTLSARGYAPMTSRILYDVIHVQHIRKVQVHPTRVQHVGSRMPHVRIDDVRGGWRILQANGTTTTSLQWTRAGASSHHNIECVSRPASATHIRTCSYRTTCTHIIIMWLFFFGGMSTRWRNHTFAYTETHSDAQWSMRCDATFASSCSWRSIDRLEALTRFERIVTWTCAVLGIHVLCQNDDRDRDRIGFTDVACVLVMR